MRCLLLLMLYLPACALAQVYKWTDAQGVLHFGDVPPPAGKADALRIKGASGAQGVAASIGNDFMLGRWQSEAFEAYDTPIPVQVYVYYADRQGVEGKSQTLRIDRYVINGRQIRVLGSIPQTFTVVDANTVTYVLDGVKGVRTLRRLPAR
ncbi:hypothetical protein IGB42_01895 [Andreprevotia sp. IGB-42]|uniref:DUF4124 domain-containing protein n=1 Tax=Andreprevotia sp. IGB-42 TaxID=2497473 RepID=UPI00135B02AE|nr:DUF4124 domain-containing protein [Andreprevotia sp. IGB-42]KAF0813544.1 hypothetical protein IGB42_01895 [Andreprevotia sp. IGB-42]